MSLQSITPILQQDCSRMENEVELKKEYDELIKKEKLLDEELEKWNRERAKKEMDLLHTYNEVKDATQIILATLAKFEGVTIKKMHERFDLPLGE